MSAVRASWIWLLLGLIAILAACRQEQPASVPDPATSTPALSTSAPAEQEHFSTQINNYNLGESTILQDHYPEDSRFREMPVRLDGVIGVPEGQGPFPLVLILHGSHLICPGEDAWPCAEGEEQPNYAGFAYLVEALAEAGYVALSINGNAEHTFAFGEAPAGERTKQLIDVHLAELSAAVAGESDAFGLDLTGRIDLTQMTWLGHSRGGDLVNRIIREESLDETTSASGYGPVQGLIMLAPPIITTDVLPAVDLPTALILPACDWDVDLLAGQLLYESARLDPDRLGLFTSIYLEHGNHANFNAILEPDPIIDNRPDCAAGQMLSPQEQQSFIAQYAVDFLRTIYAAPADAVPIKQRIGLSPATPAAAELYDRSVQITTLQPVASRLTVMQPRDEDELSRNLLGGEVKLNGLSAVFCPEGYYVPANEPGTEPCKRVNFSQPGYPQMIALSWDSDDAAWRTTIPDSTSDLSGYDMLQLRAALDPLSDLNVEGQPLSFSVELVNGSGRRAEVSELSLAYPPGFRLPNDFFEGDRFTGHVMMHVVQIPLEAFGEIDMTNIDEINLLFDQSPGGALFVADLELVKNDR